MSEMSSHGMYSHEMSPAVRSASIINLLAAIWLFVSPWVYRVYSNHDSWNSWIVGGLIGILALIRLANPIGTRGLSVINLILGAWVFVSPWVYGYTVDTGRFVNSLCVGVIVFIAGLVGSSATESRTPLAH